MAYRMALALVLLTLIEADSSAAEAPASINIECVDRVNLYIGFANEVRSVTKDDEHTDTRHNATTHVHHCMRLLRGFIARATSKLYQPLKQENATHRDGIIQSKVDAERIMGKLGEVVQRLENQETMTVRRINDIKALITNALVPGRPDDTLTLRRFNDTMDSIVQKVDKLLRIVGEVDELLEEIEASEKSANFSNDETLSMSTQEASPVSTGPPDDTQSTPHATAQVDPVPHATTEAEPVPHATTEAEPVPHATTEAGTVAHATTEAGTVPHATTDDQPMPTTARFTPSVPGATTQPISRASPSIPEPREEACNKTFYGNKGRLLSLGYPGQYPTNIFCYTRVSGLPGTKLALFFDDFFMDNRSNCASEYMKIYDGSNERSPLIRKMCGSNPQRSVLAEGNNVYLEFRTDSFSSTGLVRRFDIAYVSYRGACNKTFTSGYGRIFSPGWPRNYPNNLVCNMRISGPPGTKLSLFYNYFKMESNEDCSYDYLKIHDGTDSSAPVIDRICGHVFPTPLQASGNNIYLVFKTDSSVAHYGFDITYTSYEGSCNGVYSGESGRIVSPGWPGNYPNNAVCNIRVSVPSGQAATLFFDSFSLEHQVNCSYDYLKVYDGYNRTAPLIKKLCGKNLPEPVLLSDNEAFLEFKTDGSVRKRGFDIKYIGSTPACHRNFTSRYGRILSPGWPGLYADNLACNIRVSGPQGTRISLSFDSFNVESHELCSYDYLKVFDGSDNSAPLIGKLCGDTLPVPVRSTGRHLYMEFKTDGSQQYKGFDLFYVSRDM